MHVEHWIEFVPTPFPQTPQGNFPDLSLRPAPSQHFITFVLPKLTLSPFPSIPALHLSNFSINSSILSANRTRSSAYSNSIGKPSLNSLDRASSTMMNSKGLSTEPWCTPTLTTNALLTLPFTFTAVDASSYIDLITDTIHSSTPNFRKAHHTTSLGTLSKAFSKSTKAIHRSFFFAKYFSCSCLTTNIASVVPLPAINPNCMSSTFTIRLTLPSITLSRLFITCSSNFIPLYEPHSRASPFPL